MVVLYHLIFGILAMAGLVFGAQIVIYGAKHIAIKLGLSEFFVGLTLLSILTSLPEMIEHIVASLDILRGGPAGVLAGVAIGTNIGSNIIQITLITGLVGLIGTLVCDEDFIKKDYVFMLISILILFLFAFTGSHISRLEGGILFSMYLLYLYSLQRKEGIKEKLKVKHNPLAWDFILIALGFIALLFSADHLLKEAVFFSQAYGIEGSLIGTLIIGVATSLPEFTTAMVALIKRSSGLSLGTLIGSNITNPLLALGLGAMISGYSVENSLLWFDLPFWFGISVVGYFLFLKGKHLSNKEALVLIFGYFLYVGLRLAIFV